MGRARAAVTSFWRKAYEDNLTGLASMVAYNLLLSIFPIALVALFVAGRVLRSEDLQASVLLDLKQAVPDRRREHAEQRASGGCRSSSTSAGIAALAGRRVGRRLVLGRTRHRVLPHLPPAVPRWVRQKLFGLAHARRSCWLFIVATVAVPALQASLIASSGRDLPFGLSEVEGLMYVRDPGAGGLIRSSACSASSTRACRGADPVAMRVAGCTRGDGGDGRRRLRVPALPGQRLDHRRVPARRRRSR